MKRISKSLVFKISFSIFLIELGALSALGIFYLERFSAEIDARVRTNAQLPGKLMEQRILGFDAARDREAMRRLIGETLTEAMVIRRDGLVFYASNREKEGKEYTGVVDPTTRHRLASGMTRQISEPVLFQGNGYIEVFSPLRPENKLLGYLFLKVDTTHSRQEKGAVATIFAIGSLLCIFLTTATEIVLVHMLTIPGIRASLKCLKAVGEGDIGARIFPATSPDEIGQLQRGINAAVEEIQKRIQAQQEAENKLRKNKEELNLYFEYTPAATAMCDRNMRYLAHSRRWIVDYHLPDENLIGQCHYDVFETIPEKWKQEHIRCFQGEVIVNDEEPFNRKDGTMDWVRRSLHPWRTESGEIGGLIMFTEVTTRKREAETALKRLRNYLANIIDSMPSVLVGIDTEGRVTQWNRQAERETGISSEAAAGKMLGLVFPRLQSETDNIRKAIEKRQVQRDPGRSRTCDGETRYEDITIYPLATNGDDGAVIRVDDATERTRLEGMIVQSEKMLSVGGLAAGMAHEINNPLAGMIQTAIVMADRLTKEIPANEKAAEAAGATMASIGEFMEARGILRMLDTIRESGKRAADIVQNMLSFSRKSDSAISSHSMAALLDDSLELAGTDYDLRKQYDFRNIEIVREYDEAALPIPCEKQKIQQVFLNILKNGAESMQSQNRGHNPRFFLRVANEDKMVRVEIEDNGPGIDKITRKRAFEPFFTTKPPGVGTGLGLSVSYFIVSEIHGGTMSVESPPGKGAKFVVKLPKERTPK